MKDTAGQHEEDGHHHQHEGHSHGAPILLTNVNRAFIVGTPLAQVFPSKVLIF